jgi:RNA polymerase sigma factor (sigma-70 family)
MLNEKQLVEACINNDRAAQKQLYQLFAAKLFVLAKRYLKDPDDAQDVLQDTFIKIYKNLASFRFDCPFEAWIKRICINTALKALSKKKEFTLGLDSEYVFENAGNDSNLGLQNLSLNNLIGIVNELPEGCKTIFNLYAIEGFKHHEIAELLNITEGTSKSQYSRAKMLLQQKLKIEENRESIISNSVKI